ncbi:protein of unknown function [Micromonospora phaseoli]|uniref:DUF4265 domain-containing protein n=2 Tax=Micromonospora phaseoli TaxID=1144548 RepID=A0A1H6SDQ0_9ACTN|nr:uncharacterized protein DUF4265 [Micromonospora phaseoli]SEI62130.1 protein of unknown function [Micromonospora phaseoli]
MFEYCVGFSKMGPHMASGSVDVHAQREAEDIKVWFRFIPREGWLPFDTEGLWATRVGEDLAQVRNVPFLQDGVAEDDIIRFVTDADGWFWSVEQVQASGNCTVRVLPNPAGPLGRSARAVHAEFAAFNLGGEVFSEQLPLVAFNIPADADFAAIKLVLERGQNSGWWHYEVGSGSTRWWDA